VEMWWFSCKHDILYYHVKHVTAACVTTQQWLGINGIAIAMFIKTVVPVESTILSQRLVNLC